MNSGESRESEPIARLRPWQVGAAAVVAIALGAAGALSSSAESNYPCEELATLVDIEYGENGVPEVDPVDLTTLAHGVNRYPDQSDRAELILDVAVELHSADGNPVATSAAQESLEVLVDNNAAYMRGHC